MFEVINLIEKREAFGFEDFSEPYPGNDPCTHNSFQTRYSDHHPFRFKMKVDNDDRLKHSYIIFLA